MFATETFNNGPSSTELGMYVETIPDEQIFGPCLNHPNSTLYHNAASCPSHQLRKDEFLSCEFLCGNGMRGLRSGMIEV
jgi:hypothetical protein